MDGEDIGDFIKGCESDVTATLYVNSWGQQSVTIQCSFSPTNNKD